MRTYSFFYYKQMCAIVRNEYSTSCLQADFRAGLKELYRKDDDDDDGTQADKDLPDFEDMSVFCISANDYLKVMKIKTRKVCISIVLSCA